MSVEVLKGKEACRISRLIPLLSTLLLSFLALDLKTSSCLWSAVLLMKVSKSISLNSRLNSRFFVAIDSRPHLISLTLFYLLFQLPRSADGSSSQLSRSFRTRWRCSIPSRRELHSQFHLFPRSHSRLSFSIPSFDSEASSSRHCFCSFKSEYRSCSTGSEERDCK